jgi:hypothetical protein
VNGRLKSFLGGIAIVVFLLAYVSAAVALADHLPDNQCARLAFFAVAGLAWGVPLIPLLSWMAKGR